ncbi:LOW QUALITY PROTEIN: B-cell antigen receptor complex-associated protein alpha chain-like [Pseudopipra pipra]|uniref:LOW QUALITY PROTEIN: B-cell antigen receptor complex-associated protein alpha chain-like n=1 Tax=Pseudopipra pipra TaxID=415032 RepID=UPI003138CB84
MEGAPQNQRPPPNWGVTRPLLILILLLAGSQCSQTPPEGCASCPTPSLPPSPEPPETPTPVIVTTGSPPTPSCSPAPPRGWLRVWGGPPSREGRVGTPLTLECHFRGPPDTALTWLQACPPALGEVPRSCPWPQEVVATRGGRRMDRVVQEGGGSSTLTFPKLSHNDSGLFFCRVESGGETAQSCGTFVRVLEPVPAPFLALRESTKNRILTAQGVLLLLCSAGPGLLLLLRKRWANEQLLHPEKTTCEEENLYEGLNLDECSMYEDISRGVQPTYQDVGTLPGDSQLEKP